MEKFEATPKNESFVDLKQRMTECTDEIMEKLFLGYGSTDRAIHNFLETGGVDSSLDFVLENNLDKFNQVKDDIGEKKLTDQEFNQLVKEKFTNFINTIKSADFEAFLKQMKISRDLGGIEKIIKEAGL